MLSAGVRTVLAFVTGLVVAVLGSGVAAACSCPVGTAEEHAEWASVVALVHVDRMELPNSGFSGADVVYQVTASRAWKGDVPLRFSFVSAQSGASCGLEGITEGQDLLLFARLGEGDRLTASLCGGTSAASEALVAEITALLGEGTVPIDTGEQPASALPGWILPVTIGAVIAAGVVTVLVRRRLPPDDSSGSLLD